MMGNLIQGNDFGTEEGPYLAPLQGFIDGAGTSVPLLVLAIRPTPLYGLLRPRLRRAEDRHVRIAPDPANTVSEESDACQPPTQPDDSLLAFLISTSGFVSADGLKSPRCRPPT